MASFQYGTANANLPNYISVEPRRRQKRYVIGADGSFDAGGTHPGPVPRSA